MNRGDERSFDSLLAYIEREMEFESGFYNDAYLDRRITARMRRTDHHDYAAYQRRLEEDPAERERLLDALSIHVTGFFRNPGAWETLRGVLRELADSRRRIRIWSAPCADGREPYSLAMLALEDDAVDECRVDILATDRSADVLATARAGVYESSRTSDIAEELEPLGDYSRYVDREGARFEVRDRVQSLVEFERHDLISGDPKRDFDVILCRNLLIYIDGSYKEPILETVRGSLREGGYLMLGMTETLPAASRRHFEPVHKKQRIYRRT